MLEVTAADRAVAKYLVSIGYKQVSRAYREVARVDISDVELVKFFLRESMCDESGRGHLSGVASLPLERQKDHYRRVYAMRNNDLPVIEPEPVMQEMRRLGAVAW